MNPNNKQSIAVTGKVPITDFDLLTELVKKNPAKNKSAIIAEALHQYLTGEQKGNDPELEQKLKDLQTENAGLKQKNETVLSENENLTAEVAALRDMLESSEQGPNPAELEALKKINGNQKDEIENLKNEIENLKNQPPKTLKLSANQLLLNVPPTLQPFLVEVSNRETNRTGRTVTPDMILLNLFWAQVSKGPGDHLPMTFSPAEIRRRLEIVKQNQKAKDE